MSKRRRIVQKAPYSLPVADKINAIHDSEGLHTTAQGDFSLESLLQEVEIDAATDSSQGVGTKATGFTKAEYGPFLCIVCSHSNREGNRCNHPEVMADPDVEQDGDMAVIEPGDCCNFYRPRTAKG